MYHRPKKSLGQNFLIDGNLQRKIVGALRLELEDEVLEIGPGRGALTRHMVGECSSLILVELDRELAGRLEADFRDSPGVRVVNGDILKFPLDSLSQEPSSLKVVGNIPYNITSPILFHLLRRPRPREIILMVQKEVGERVLAESGGSAFGALTVGVRSVANVERVVTVPSSAFRPRPAVDSVVLRIEPFRPEPLELHEEEALRTLTRAAFQQRRKQFQTILRGHPSWGVSREQIAGLEEGTGFDLRRRPETFSPADFIALSRALQELQDS
ncbi:MAG: ribosomal RNA small subunit methyltransferase A [Gemmatimonadetes bacterium]|nr:ribosomal RNA small subunit methyltransferase A [Gemmatimonadota bacterium]NNM04821.1 ribosomal RNA small subunit methyltransferase A [Gemmatimonadota bacterium]